MSSGLKTREPYSHSNWETWAPWFLLAGNEDTVGKHVSWQKGSKAAQHPQKREPGVQTLVWKGLSVSPQQSWRRRFEDMQVLGEKREVMERGDRPGEGYTNR